MDRRTVLIAGVGALGVELTGKAAQPQVNSGKMAEMPDCIALCAATQRACLAAIAHLLRGPRGAATWPAVAALMDCAELCQATAHAMIRESPAHAVFCKACADICERCVEQCRLLQPDKIMQHCIDQCTQCAKSCREMGSMGD